MSHFIPPPAHTHIRAILHLVFVFAILILSEAKGIAHNEFVLFTQPKTGTNLVAPLLSLMTGKTRRSASGCDFSYPTATKTEEEYNSWISKPGYVPVYMHHRTIPQSQFSKALDSIQKSNEFYCAHTPYSLELDQLLQARGTTIFFIVRDPRDYIVSGAFFYGSSTRYAMFPRQWYQSLTLDDQLMVMITGTEWYNSAAWILSAFTGWLSSPNCEVIFFENLVSSNSALRLKQLRSIARALGLAISDSDLENLYQDAFGKGPTFHSGTAGKWRSIFNLKHKDACRSCFGELLIQLGYENDYDW